MSKYVYWTEGKNGRHFLCRRVIGNKEAKEYAAIKGQFDWHRDPKGQFDWRRDPEDPDVLKFMSEVGALVEADNRGISMAKVN